MKILFFIGTLWTGGAERQTAQLAYQLSLKGHDVTVLTVFAGGEIRESLRRLGSVTLLACFKRKAKYKVIVLYQLISAIFKLRCLVKKKDVSIIYSVLEFSNLIAWLASRWISRIKLIWSVRASDMDLNWKLAMAFYLSSWISHRVSLLIANSHAGLVYYENKGYKAHRHLVIPNGIDTELFAPNQEYRTRVRAEWGIKDNEKLIGMVARLDPIKGYPSFIRAAACLIEGKANTKFVCVGDGPLPYRVDLQQLSREMSLGDRMIWVGSRSDMPAVYNALDIAVLASYSEGFPNVVGEAMACGVPCVVTDAGDAAMIVGETGVVVPPQDPTALAKGIERLLEGSPTPAVALRRRVIEQFSLGALLESTERALIALTEH